MTRNYFPVEPSLCRPVESRCGSGYLHGGNIRRKFYLRKVCRYTRSPADAVHFIDRLVRLPISYRINVLNLCIIVAGMAVFSIVGALSQTYNVYVACRFCTALFNGGAGLVSFVLLTEVIGASKRSLAGAYAKRCHHSNACCSHVFTPLHARRPHSDLLRSRHRVVRSSWLFLPRMANLVSRLRASWLHWPLLDQVHFVL